MSMMSHDPMLSHVSGSAWTGGLLSGLFSRGLVLRTVGRFSERLRVAVPFSVPVASRVAGLTVPGPSLFRPRLVGLTLPRPCSFLPWEAGLILPRPLSLPPLEVGLTLPGWSSPSSREAGLILSGPSSLPPRLEGLHLSAHDASCGPVSIGWTRVLVRPSAAMSCK